MYLLLARTFALTNKLFALVEKVSNCEALNQLDRVSLNFYLLNIVLVFSLLHLVNCKVFDVIRLGLELGFLIPETYSASLRYFKNVIYTSMTRA